MAGGPVCAKSNPMTTPEQPALPLKYRKLRIAWSAGWGLVAILLLATWIRSYWYVDFWYVKLPGVTHSPGIAWMQGFVFLDAAIVHIGDAPPWHRFGPVGIMTIWNPNNEGILYVEGRFIQIWILAPIAMGLVALPWVYRRFSLRGILILMTLIAVLLGLSRWSALRYLKEVHAPINNSGSNSCNLLQSCSC